MNTDKNFKAKFKGEISGNELTGELTIRYFDQKARTKRAVKVGGILFGLAVLSIAVPILHFVLVPSFLIASPIAAFVAFGSESQLLSANVMCPECSVPFKIAPGKPVFPYKDVCASCHRKIIINCDYSENS